VIIQKHSRKAGPAVALLAALTTALILATASLADTPQYSYDTMQRLTRVTYGDGTAVDYVYDTLGNRLLKTTTLPGAPSNQPPAAVTNPSIANGVTNVPAAAALSWSPAVDPNRGVLVTGQYEMKRRP
jgi:YD repeat-containing protein